MQNYPQPQQWGGGMGNSGVGLMTGQGGTMQPGWQSQYRQPGGIPGGWPGPAPNWKYGGGYSGGVSGQAPASIDASGGFAPQQQWGGLQDMGQGAPAAPMSTGVAPVGTYVGGGGLLGPWGRNMTAQGRMSY